MTFRYQISITDADSGFEKKGMVKKGNHFQPYLLIPAKIRLRTLSMTLS